MFNPALGGMLLVSAAKLVPAPTPRDNTEAVVRIIFRTFTSMIARWKNRRAILATAVAGGRSQEFATVRRGFNSRSRRQVFIRYPLKQGFSSVQQPQNDWPEKRQDCHYSASDISGT